MNAMPQTPSVQRRGEPSTVSKKENRLLEMSNRKRIETLWTGIVFFSELLFFE